ncbi:hypothetical protein EYY60_13975 [Flavobacterium zhairuonense]|uniref:hypothetical protein n=1 Tax=Flavobacterium zhairuonense TaxID=2493631 RepID=UPI001050EA02|nr:hypothetical protein [Flavobacterium zhairuonense]KAF2509479.1 hypothetical protein EYY60_13975 [Flavobacterium zhairuonense]
MNKVTKLLIRILTVVFILGFMVCQGLRLMDIEDRYGDLQDVYYDSESGDILINNLNKKTGKILLENNRVFVVDNDKKFELEEWLGPNSHWKCNLNVYGKDSKSNTKVHIEYEY